MPTPYTEKEVRGFLGHLNYISRFISLLTATCEPILKLLKKDQAVKWNDDFQNAFDNVVPQNFPSHILQEIAKPSHKIPQGLCSATVSYTVKTRVCVLIKKRKFSKAQSSLICLQRWSSILISSFKAFSSKLHSQNPRLHYSQL